MGPTVAVVTVTAALKSFPYPASVMALISMAPRPPTSAMAAPEVPENMRLATALTWARPPGRVPTRVLAKSKIRVVIPDTFMRLPTRTKSGIASSVKEFPIAYVSLEATMSKERGLATR